jgi:hypothetical protein
MCRDANASQIFSDNIQRIGGATFGRFSEAPTALRPLADAPHRHHGLS